MVKNESTLDRGVRLVSAVVALVIALIVGASSVVGIILIVVAGILLATAVVGFCPLYRIFGIRSDKA